jgi:Flp pilus assembly protein TadD
MASNAAALVAKGRVGSSADAQMLVACATAALHKEAHREAYGMLDQALTLDPENVRAWVLMGMCHEQAGRIASAREAYAMALGLDDKHPSCRMAQKRLALLDPG